MAYLVLNLGIEQFFYGCSGTVFCDRNLWSCDKYQTLVCQIQSNYKLWHGAYFYLHILYFVGSNT